MKKTIPSIPFSLDPEYIKGLITCDQAEGSCIHSSYLIIKSAQCSLVYNGVETELDVPCPLFHICAYANATFQSTVDANFIVTRLEKVKEILESIKSHPDGPAALMEVLI